MQTFLYQMKIRHIWVLGWNMECEFTFPSNDFFFHVFTLSAELLDVDWLVILSRTRTMAKLKIAQEVIDFQNGDFANDLEAIMTEIKIFVEDHGHACGRLLMRQDFHLRMSELIFKRTGIQTDIEMNTNTFGCIWPCYLNTSHALLDSYWHGMDYLKFQKEIVAAAKKKEGWVDLKKARVGGVFSEYEHPVEFGAVLNFLDAGFSPRECAAIMMHELGHAFTYYEFSDRLTTTNQILVDLANAVNEKDSKKRVFILKELGENMSNNPDMFNDLGDETNRVIFGIKLFKRCVGWVSSQVPLYRVTELSSEQLADNFATRFGLGRELVTVLFKIDKLYESPELKQYNDPYIPFFSMLAIFFGCVMYGVAGIAIGWVIAIFMALLWVLGLFKLGEQAKDYTHGEIRIRYKRVRDQMIERLHRADIDAVAMKQTIQDIKIMDSILSKVTEYQSVTDKLSNFLLKKNRDIRADTELQLLMEDLTHNNLFLKSAELQTIGH
jgi:hypothetical protein